MLANNGQELITSTSPLLQVQANFFKCGGLTIGLSMSHKITDASTLGLFLKAWSATSASKFNHENLTFAKFSLASVYPVIDPALLPPSPNQKILGDLTVKRYVFEKSKISLLKEKAIGQGVRQPTRVECVNALLWKSSMDTSRSRFGNTIRPSMFMQAINLRKRMVPAVAENTIRNIVWLFMANIETMDNKIELKEVITSIRRTVEDGSEMAAKGYDQVVPLIIKMIKEMRINVINEDIDLCSSTSWCRFSFYEADFGWGKPTWINPYLRPLPVMKNIFILVDSSDGVGIEAWYISLDQEDSAHLERHQHFLAYAAINPTIVY
ncbi:hypothetical protein ACFE04_006240 [Oxalis oulophora]